MHGPDISKANDIVAHPTQNVGGRRPSRPSLPSPRGRCPPLSLSLSLHKRRLFIATRQPAVSRSLYQVDEFIYRQVDTG